ncbi:cystathionine beta-lyase/cystathionine gamma-synthase [Crossiella equi]|uniref:Cystathionine beta-lyase/cystathionine gamma-synthase n=1 Tax=Crossiella equi TaxID=130796 RepID=A0ABS5AR16_9PSEU|nr:PLP-dependent aspartate aminotransferase family protein [Crossiella equi]MBP2478150.1 cystathionine beta-lyase/cystathionine gamma-synthase [Crossiella equi]
MQSIQYSGSRTRAVHAGRDELGALGVHALPLDLSTTYPIADPGLGEQALLELAEGAPAAASPVYGRLHNPTVARFERALAALEGLPEAVAFASGMAAVAAVLQAACVLTGRRHVVAVRPLYGGTDHLLASGLLGTETTYATPDGVAAAIRPDTGLVVVETPANPTLDLVDLTALAAAAGDVPLLVDNTFATPVLQNPAAHGATYVLHSATKYLGGHGDTFGGVVAAPEHEAAALRSVRVVTGALLHPLAGYLLHRGLATLPVRVEAAQRTAAELARRLAAHPSVAAVHYPGLPGADPGGLVGGQLRGPGAVLAFETFEESDAVLSGLRLLTHAVSLGSVDSLIERPAALTHRVVAEEDRLTCGISPRLLRVSVGLEDVEDLWLDLDQSLNSAKRVNVIPVTS